MRGYLYNRPIRPYKLSARKPRLVFLAKYDGENDCYNNEQDDNEEEEDLAVSPRPSGRVGRLFDLR